MKRTQHTVKFRRKKKTNYKKRLKILLSKKTRLVVRKSLKSITAQMIKHDPKGDKVLVSVNSKKLQNLGWSGSKKNLPSAYLTGLLIGTESKKKGINEAVLDIGLSSPVKKSKVYATLKGVIDAGIKVPCSEEVFPNEERIKGQHITDYVKQIKGKSNQFSALKEKSDIIQKEFETIKNNIVKGGK